MIFLITILAGYLLVVAVGAIVMQPLRRRMFRTAEEMLAQRHWNDVERDHLNHLLDTAVSFKVGLMLPIAILLCLFATVMRVSAPTNVTSRLRGDPRYHRVLELHFVSVLAVNPLASIFSLLLLVLLFLVEALYCRFSLRRAVEEPVVIASSRVAVAR